jgi:hypothetical protein
MKTHLVKVITIFAMMSMLITPASAKSPDKANNLSNIAAPYSTDNGEVYSQRLNL